MKLFNRMYLLQSISKCFLFQRFQFVQLALYGQYNYMHYISINAYETKSLLIFLCYQSIKRLKTMHIYFIAFIFF